MMTYLYSKLPAFVLVICGVLGSGSTTFAQPQSQMGNNPSVHSGFTFKAENPTIQTSIYYDGFGNSISHNTERNIIGNHITGFSDTQNRYRVNQRPQTRTLFSSGIRHGGYGSLVYGITSINGEITYLRGTRGAWIIHFAESHAIQLGLAGYRTSSDIELTSWSHDDADEPGLRTNYGGFEVEYVNRSHKLIHFGTQLLVGSGEVRYDERNVNVDKTRDSYFVLQPGANMHLNVTSWFRVSGGAFYRYAANVNLEGTSDSELSGLTGILGLRFGRF